MSCSWNIDGRCRHPRLPKQPVSDGRCDTCREYSGRVRGVGDVVAIVAKATGVEAVAKSIESATGKPCGCGGRRAALNRSLPFRNTE